MYAGFSAQSGNTTTDDGTMQTPTTEANNTSNLPSTSYGTATTQIITNATGVRMYIIIGAIVGTAVVVVIVASTILCTVFAIKKHCKRKSSIDLSTGSEKSPNRDGYVNALYDG